MSGSASGADLLGRLADEFLERHRRGERPALTEFTSRHPELAEQIRDLFPALALLEEVRPVKQTVAEAQADLAEAGPPRRLGEYRIVREIGRGGMGIVYEAEQESLGRRVALKVLLAGVLKDSRHVERFQREARAAARLHHTNIVPIFAVGEETGTHYFVMQYIEGRPLDQLLAELRKLRAASDLEAEPRTEIVAVEDRPAPVATVPPGLAAAPALTNPDRSFAKNVAQIGVQVAEALEYAAGQGVLHRDVKPSNLLLDVWGTVWLTDFGLAKATGTPDLTRTGDLLGTLRYLAPERFEGRADVRSDVYALGLTLYEMLALRPAFDGRHQAELVQQITTAGAPRLDRLDPHLPRDLVTIIHKATAREPADRYPTAGALAEDLRRFLDDRSILARRTGVLEQGWRWCRRNRALAAALGATGLALAAGLTFSLAFAFGEKAARQRADDREQDARTSEAKAVQSAKTARREVEKLYVANGRREEDDGNLFGALLWLVRPLAGETGPAEDEATHRLRLGCYFRHARRPTLVQVLDNHEPVARAVLRPDGRRLVTAGREKTAQIWDPRSGRRLATLGHEGQVWHVAYSPDGQRIVTASKDQTARLWEANSGNLLFTLRHQGPVSHAAFSPDSRSVVTSCGDATARVWEVASGQESRPPLRHRAPVKFALFSPDQRWILTCTDDQETPLLLWDAQKPTDRAEAVLQYQNEKTGSVNSAVFSRDGHRVLFTDDNRSAQVWDLVTRHRTLLLKHPAISVRSAAFSPDERRIVTADNGGAARFWDATTGEPSPVVLQQVRTVDRVVFSPDGGRVVTGGWDRTARVWDASRGEPLTPVLRHQGFVTDVAFGPDGDCLLTASDDGTVRVWDLAGESAWTRVLPHRGKVHAAAFSADGSRVVTAGGDEDATARVWDAATGRPVLPPIAHQRPVRCVAISPDGSRVLSAGFDGTVRVWDATTGQDLMPPLQHHQGTPPDTLQAASFSPDGRLILTAGGDGAARVWDAATGERRLPPLWHQKTVRAAVFSPAGSHIVTASDDETAQLWDAATGKAVGPPLVHSGGVNCAAFSRDGSRLVTAGQCRDRGWAGEARLWDAATGRPLWHVRTIGMLDLVAFSPDGRAVVTAGHGGMARVHDAVTGQPLSLAWEQGTRVLGAAFSPDSRFVAAGGADRTARIWEVATGQPISPPLWHEGEVFGVSFSPTGRTLLTYSQDGTARLWDLIPDDRPAADLVLLTQLLAGQRLDAYGALERLSPADQVAALTQLRAKYPAEFSVTAEQVMAWHRQEGAKRLWLGDRNAALFHYLHCTSLLPLLPCSSPPAFFSLAPVSARPRQPE
jgi:WD40 repeat protein/serine/threonine protein kinase